jgi:hypothetical protein
VNAINSHHHQPFVSTEASYFNSNQTPMNPKTTFIERLRNLGQLDDLRHPAKLLLEGQVLSTGIVHLQKSVSSLMFQPDNGKTLDTPIHGVTLTLRDTSVEVSGVLVEDCPTTGHYHLKPQPQAA